ncbi:phage terminase small subunit P27 family [Alcaligenes endophyticus]|uniref:Phage terminase small subunit P27 family n=1 Tax=Alcaligenes endophyticus TaxID=1929088 RepID=A0ABT8EKB7_9BURK|nr:phage terminase small subunit P27 family [Alcaligenes endophyticus]MCX5592035.1 phage terminase small subunit P27 family [Alcaligenes endophyticus]MDN4121725.1 phage terminase small subunit P27 family [Alcaligenes endophyticus]
MAGVPGRSGRRPKPTERKVAAGNPGKRALNKSAPEFGGIIDIEPPVWLEGAGRDLWEHLAPLLCAQQVLQGTDIQNLELYCTAYGRFRKAEEDIAENGITVTGAQGGIVKNPAATIINEATRQMATFGSLLGLDPSSRQRLLGPKGEDPAAVLAGILNM